MNIKYLALTLVITTKIWGGGGNIMAIEIIKTPSLDFKIKETSTNNVGTLELTSEIATAEKLSISTTDKLVSLYGYVGTTVLSLDLTSILRLTTTGALLEPQNIQTTIFSTVKFLVFINLSATGILKIEKPNNGFLEFGGTGWYVNLRGQYSKIIFEYMPERAVNATQKLISITSSIPNNYLKIFIIGT